MIVLSRHKCFASAGAAVLGFFLLFGGIALFAGRSEAQSDLDHRLLRSASELPYPPFAVVTPEGEADGFSVDLLRAVAAEMGMDVEFTVAPWNEIRNWLVDGRIDVLPLVSYSVERDMQFDFSVPYLRMHGAIFVREENAEDIEGEEDLGGREVIVMRGDTAHEYALRKHITDHLVLTDSYEEAMRLLADGKHDAVLVQQVVGLEIIKKLGLDNVVDVSRGKEVSLKPSGGPLTGFEQKFCFAVSEGRHELVAMLNEGLAIVISNGTYARLYEKWFGPILPHQSASFREILHVALMVVVPLLLVLAAGWLFMLRREVRRQTRHLVEQTTENRRAKEALEESEARFRALFEQAGWAVFVHDDQGTILDVNRHACEQLGYEREEMLKMAIPDIDPGVEPRGDKDLFWGNEPGTGISFVSRHRRKDGSEYPASITLTTVKYGGRKLIMSLVLNVTEQRKAEDFLRRSEARLQEAQRLAKVGSWEFDLELGKIWGSDGGFRIFGMVSPESNLMPIEEIEACIPERERVHQALVDLINEDKPYDLEYEVVPADGSRKKTVISKAKLEKDENGTPVKITGVVWDITEQKKAEAALKESEERLRMLAEASFAGVIIHDKGRLLEANDQYFEMFGYSPDELRGKADIEKTIVSEYVGTVMAKIVSGATDRYEAIGRRKDGTTFPIEIKARNVRYKGKSARAAVVTDISERKQSEAALAEAHKRLSFHVENSPLAVIDWEDGTHIKTWSKQAETLFGWTEEEVLGKNWNDFDILHPGDMERAEKLLARLFDGRDTFNTISNRNYRKDRSVVHCQWYNSALRDENGRMVSLLSQVADLTEVRKYEESLVQAKEMAEVANRAKSEFLANMSHEVRTPLNGLLGMLQLMSTTGLTDEQREYVGQALLSGKRLTRLLADILDLSRVEAGKMKIFREKFDFYDTMEAVRQLFALSIQEKKLEFRMHINPDIPAVLVGDATRLQQVLSNLVGNAIKFTDQGTVELDAHPLPTLVENEYRVLFSVSDTGIGIPDKMQEELFAPFVQGESDFRRRFQGAGLGLAISRNLVELMGGSMAVESTEGEGSAFHFCATFKLPESECANLTKPEAVSVPSGLRVLVAEDDHASRMVAVRCLENLGHQVKTVENGKQALETLKRDVFDLVLMDVQMPLLDGVEVTGAVRGGELGTGVKGIPIIAVTAYAMAGDRERFLEAGMNGYLAKPIDVEALKSAISNVM